MCYSVADVVFIVPYRPSNERRRLLWNWCERRLRILFPEARISVGLDDRAGPFCRSYACNLGVKQSTGSVLAIIDSDVLFSREAIEESVDMLNLGSPWVMGYKWKMHLAESRSNKVLKSRPDVDVSKIDIKIDEPYRGTETQEGGTSSLLLLSRSNFDMVGGFDERFMGWNYEDQAFATALTVLLGKQGVVSRPLFHLWHPFAPEMLEKPPIYHQGEQLFRRYEKAKTAELMRALIRERDEID